MRFVLTSLLLGFLLLNSAAKAEEGKIDVQSNDLQQAESGCRAVFVLHNGLAEALEALTFRIVAFDAKGSANLFLSLDVGAMPAGKTRVLRFDLGKDVACKDVGRLVLDGVTSCSGTGIDPDKCLNELNLSTRLSVPFDF